MFLFIGAFCILKGSLISTVSGIQFENAAVIVDVVNWKPWFDSRVPSKRMESEGQYFRPDEIDTRKRLNGWREPAIRPPVYQLRYVNEKFERWRSVDELSYYLEPDGRYLNPKTLHMLEKPGSIARSLVATGITWATRDLVRQAQVQRKRRARDERRTLARLRGRV